MRIRIRVDVRKPLKRKKKIIRKNGPEFIVLCKYERLRDFCFRYGLLSHTERFCQKKFQQMEETEKEWGGWLRAQPRRVVGKSKWLREYVDDGWSERYGMGSNNQVVAENQEHGSRKTGIMVRNNRDGILEDDKSKKINISKLGKAHKAGLLVRSWMDWI